jgi:hypothetical protein
MPVQIQPDRDLFQPLRYFADVLLAEASGSGTASRQDERKNSGRHDQAAHDGRNAESPEALAILLV